MHRHAGRNFPGRSDRIALRHRVRQLSCVVRHSRARTSDGGSGGVRDRRRRHGNPGVPPFTAAGESVCGWCAASPRPGLPLCQGACGRSYHGSGFRAGRRSGMSDSPANPANLPGGHLHGQPIRHHECPEPKAATGSRKIAFAYIKLTTAAVSKPLLLFTKYLQIWAQSIHSISLYCM